MTGSQNRGHPCPRSLCPIRLRPCSQHSHSRVDCRRRTGPFIQTPSASPEAFPPAARKHLRRFSCGEAARLIGVDDGYLRRLSIDGKGPPPEIRPNGRRSYSIEDIQALRTVLDETAKTGRRYQRHRRDGEHLQVITVANFKGGSGKTTTAAHLAQHLALQGYRVLAIGLDPQASLTALHGYQPEFDVGENETLYAAIRYDATHRELRDVIGNVPADVEKGEAALPTLSR